MSTNKVSIILTIKTTILSCYTLLERCFTYKLCHIKILALCVYFNGLQQKKITATEDKFIQDLSSF